MNRPIWLGLALVVCARLSYGLEVPYLSGRVVDNAHLLDTPSIEALENVLKENEEKTGRQIAVLTLPSLEGESIEDFSMKVARTWQLGQKGKNDGILLLVAVNDRKMRIEVGYGLEGSLPDAAAGRIIRNVMIPYFKAHQESQGIKEGVNAILATLDGTNIEIPTHVNKNNSNGMAQLGLLEKILMSCFIFGVFLLFESVGIVTPGFGWFLYLFMIPFWSAFPMAIWGAKVGLATLGLHLIGFPILKILLPKTSWGQAIAKNISSSHNAYRGHSGWSSGSSGWSGGGGGFSGGGGSFGGGGSSGSW